MKIAFIISTATLLSTAGISEIIQMEKADFVAFEAEDFSVSEKDKNIAATVISEWQVVPNALAGNGNAIKAVTGGAPIPESSTAYVTYKIQFTTPGLYTLYFRALGATTAHRSAFHSDGFDVDPASVDFKLFNIETDKISDSFQWLKQRSANRFAVQKPNQTVEFTVKIRQRFYQIDKFVFSLKPNLTGEELDRLENSQVMTH
ncbi:MAG: hypothetical protein WC959_00225 [Kiritimatiellales bacterium]